MLIRTAIAAVLLTFSLHSPAEALKDLVRLSPPIRSDAFVFESRELENGKTRIVIKRNPLQAREPANPELHLVRGASLQVNDGRKSIATVPVAVHEDKSGWLVYRFDIDPGCLPYSRFTLSETEDYKDGTGYIGGGTIYEFSLVETDSRAEELQRLIETIATPELTAEELEKLLKTAPPPVKER